MKCVVAAGKKTNSYLKHPQSQGNMGKKDWIRKKYIESYH